MLTGHPLWCIIAACGFLWQPAEHGRLLCLAMQCAGRTSDHQSDVRTSEPDEECHRGNSHLTAANHDFCADSFLVQAGSGVATLGLPDSPGVQKASAGGS